MLAEKLLLPSIKRLRKWRFKQIRGGNRHRVQLGEKTHDRCVELHYFLRVLSHPSFQCVATKVFQHKGLELGMIGVKNWHRNAVLLEIPRNRCIAAILQPDRVVFDRNGGLLRGKRQPRKGAVGTTLPKIFYACIGICPGVRIECAEVIPLGRRLLDSADNSAVFMAFR